jgi:hypothetical protein
LGTHEEFVTERKGVADLTWWGEGPHRKQLRYYEISLVSALMGVVFGQRRFHVLPSQAPWREFSSKEYSNNPRSVEELKHNTEQTVTNTDPVTLRIVARNTLTRKMDASFLEGSGHFRHLM